MKKSLYSFIVLFIYSLTSFSQVSESCDCQVDTLGYSTFVQTLSPDENASFQFHVNGTFAVAYGVIGSNTPNAVQDLITNSPEVSTIVMLACPGSEDDEANLEASTLIHEQGYKMYLPINGWIASGATDMFIAGSVRVAEITPDPVGVHAWGDGGSIEATDFPEGHEYHQPYIEYYVSTGFTQQEAEDFYYFTIYAAASNDIYWMTDLELDQYKIRSCRFSEAPSYSVSQEGNSLTADLSGASYQWINCATGVSIPESTNQTFLANNNGEYAVMITESGCSGVSECFSVLDIGIIENTFENDIKLYPNPTQGNFSLDLKNKQEAISITLVDLNGRIIQSFEKTETCLLYTSPSPRDLSTSRMPSSA